MPELRAKAAEVLRPWLGPERTRSIGGGEEEDEEEEGKRVE